jgi:hypothetical protein
VHRKRQARTVLERGLRRRPARVAVVRREREHRERRLRLVQDAKHISEAIFAGLVVGESMVDEINQSLDSRGSRIAEKGLSLSRLGGTM